MKVIAPMMIVLGVFLLLTPALAYGQRGGGGRGGGGVVRGVGGAGIGTGAGASRRTSVVDGAASRDRINNRPIGDRDGELRDRLGDRLDDRPGIGGGVGYPGLAAAAIARRVPIGTVIEVLPYGCVMTFLSEMEHYYCSGQYYQPMGNATDMIYVAVEPYIPEQY